MLCGVCTRCQHRQSATPSAAARLRKSRSPQSVAERVFAAQEAAVQAEEKQSAVASALEAATAEARALGIFGSPNFVVGGTELFWGDDRLVDAIAWYRHGSLLAG